MAVDKLLAMINKLTSFRYLFLLDVFILAFFIIDSSYSQSGVESISNNNLQNYLLLGAGIFLAIAITTIIILVLRNRKLQKTKYSYNKKSEIQLETIINSLPDLVWLKNKDGVFLSCNKKFEEFYGATESEIRGKTDYDFVDKELADVFRDNDKKALLANEPVINEGEVTFAIDGRKEFLETIKTPIYNCNKKLLGVLGVARVITSRKRIEDALFDSKEMLKGILDTIPVRVFWKDLNSAYIGSNRLFANDAGLSDSEDVINKTDIDFGFEEAEEYRADDARVMKSGESKINFEESQTLPDGGIIWLNTSKIPLRDTNGKVYGVLGTYEEITRRKLNEEKIINANKELEALTVALQKSNKELKQALEEARRSKELEIANKKLKDSEESLRVAFERISQKQQELEIMHFNLKESHIETQQLNEELQTTNDQLYFQKEELEVALKSLKDAQLKLVQSEKMASVGILTAGIAHEINNPLNFIQGGISAIEDYMQESIPNHSTDLAPLIEIVEIGINRATVIVRSLNHFNRTSNTNNEVCNIHLIIEHCLVMLQNQLKPNIEIIEIFYDKELIVTGNDGKLHQVFLNILTNSVQAIEGKGKIKISTFKENSSAKIIFSDTGTGISTDDLTKVTEPFFTTKAPGKGTGLGMSIAASIIEEHKGSLDYESQIGEGTTATVQIPLK